MTRKRSKNPRRALIQKLRDQCDKLWSKYIRTRDPKCLYCSREENLQAHHAIVTKGASISTRWNLQNGVTLCYDCHINKYHGNQASLDFHRILLQKIDHVIPFLEQEKVLVESKKIFKVSPVSLEEKKAWLESQLQILEQQRFEYEPVCLI